MRKVNGTRIETFSLDPKTRLSKNFNNFNRIGKQLYYSVDMQMFSKLLFDAALDIAEF